MVGRARVAIRQPHSIFGSDSSPMNYFSLQIELDYSYSVGDLKPYFDALSEGRTLASRCLECGYVSYPPRLICHKDHEQTEWLELIGKGRIVEITQCKDSKNRRIFFALIKMEGADNYALGRLFCDAVAKGDQVRIAAATAEADHPAQSACFERVVRS